MAETCYRCGKPVDPVLRAQSFCGRLLHYRCEIERPDGTTVRCDCSFCERQRGYDARWINDAYWMNDA